MKMMNCATAHEQLLVADIAELRGEGDSELATHLRTCAECRARATKILRGQDAMAAGLAALKPDVKAAPSHKSRAWRWAPLPLAAAAALALLLVREQGSNAVPNVDAVTRLMFRETPLIAPPAGKQALVIEKDNMTIVWLYNEEKL